MEEEVALSQWDGIIKETVELKEGTLISEGQPLFKLIKTKIENDGESRSTTPVKHISIKRKLSDDSQSLKSSMTCDGVQTSTKTLMLKDKEEIPPGKQPFYVEGRSMPDDISDYFGRAHLIKERSSHKIENLDINKYSKLVQEVNEYQKEYLRQTTEPFALHTTFAPGDCTVDEILIEENKKYDKGVPCFLLSYKRVWERGDTPFISPEELYKDIPHIDKEEPTNDEAWEMFSEVERRLDAFYDSVKMPFEPNETFQEAYNTHNELRVTKIHVKKGMKLKRYQPLFDYDLGIELKLPDGVRTFGKCTLRAMTKEEVKAAREWIKLRTKMLEEC